MGGPTYSSRKFTAEIYILDHEHTAISAALHPPKVWKQFVNEVYSILKCTLLENFFHHISNLHQNTKFTMEEESNGELAFLDTLLKQNNGMIFVLVYSSLAMLSNTYNIAITNKQVSRKVLLPSCLIEYIPLLLLLLLLLLLNLLFISHWPLLFYDNIAIHCRIITNVVC